jgi:hypothetical protein
MLPSAPGLEQLVGKAPTGVMVVAAYDVTTALIMCSSARFAPTVLPGGNG